MKKLDLFNFGKEKTLLKDIILPNSLNGLPKRELWVNGIIDRDTLASEVSTSKDIRVKDTFNLVKDRILELDKIREALDVIIGSLGKLSKTSESFTVCYAKVIDEINFNVKWMELCSNDNLPTMIKIKEDNILIIEGTNIKRYEIEVPQTKVILADIIDTRIIYLLLHDKKVIQYVPIPYTEDVLKIVNGIESKAMIKTELTCI